MVILSVGQAYPSRAFFSIRSRCSACSLIRAAILAHLRLVVVNKSSALIFIIMKISFYLLIMIYLQLNIFTSLNIRDVLQSSSIISYLFFYKKSFILIMIYLFVF
eukprot:g10984.t1